MNINAQEEEECDCQKHNFLQKCNGMCHILPFLTNKFYFDVVVNSRRKITYFFNGMTQSSRFCNEFKRQQELKEVIVARIVTRKYLAIFGIFIFLQIQNANPICCKIKEQFHIVT